MSIGYHLSLIAVLKKREAASNISMQE